MCCVLPCALCCASLHVSCALCLFYMCFVLHVCSTCIFVFSYACSTYMCSLLCDCASIALVLHVLCCGMGSLCFWWLMGWRCLCARDYQMLAGHTHWDEILEEKHKRGQKYKSNYECIRRPDETSLMSSVSWSWDIIMYCTWICLNAQMFSTPWLYGFFTLNLSASWVQIILKYLLQHHFSLSENFGEQLFRLYRSQGLGSVWELFNFWKAPLVRFERLTGSQWVWRWWRVLNSSG